MAEKFTDRAASNVTTLAFDAVSTTLTSPPARANDPELVHVAAAVYDPVRAQAGKWTRLTDDQVTAAGLNPAHLTNERSGFKAGIYTDTEKTALAFAGTDMTSLADWKTNLAQGAGLQTDQYAEAVALANSVRRVFDRASVVITGHSLGGGLATAAAAATGLDAVVFNPAGVHNNTLSRGGADSAGIRDAADRGQVRNYIVHGEVLNEIQAWLPVPKPIGQRTTLPDPAPLRPRINWIPGVKSLHSLSLHGMDAVTAAMADFQKKHDAFFKQQDVQRPSGGKSYSGELLSVPSGRIGDVTQQVGEQVVTHDRAKLAAHAGDLKAGNTVTIHYNAEATVGVVKRARVQGQGVRL